MVVVRECESGGGGWPSVVVHWWWRSVGWREVEVKLDERGREVKGEGYEGYFKEIIRIIFSKYGR